MDYINMSGTVSEVVYFNKENGYSVFDFYYEPDGLVTCTGYFPYLNPNDKLELTGRFSVHPTYGKQFKVESYTRTMPESEDELLNYLSSGIIKGIKHATAEKIVKRFGVDCLHILSDTPERLSEIKGISLKRAMEMGEAYLAVAEQEGLILFLQRHSVSASFAAKIFDRLGKNAEQRIKENPYILCEKISGISFLTCDKIALESGIRENDINRLKSAVVYMLVYSSFSGGHTYLPRLLLVSLVSKLIGIDGSEIENAITELIAIKMLIKDKINSEEAIFLPIFYQFETEIAEIVTKRVADGEGFDPKRAEQEIKKCEEESSITLAQRQRDAVLTAVNSHFSIITGGPGTGKTTTINFIISVFKSMGKKVALTAPTGRAAKRLSTVCSEEAKTIHRLLEVGYSSDEIMREFTRNENNPLEQDVIIADEASMIDVVLMHALLCALKKDAKIILVGDSDQLPPVGAGNALKDIILSKKAPVVRLDTVFRQASQSMIVVNAHKINDGEYPIYNQKDTDFFFVGARDCDDITEKIIDIVKERIPKAYGFDSIADIEVLSPMKKTAVGVISLNKHLQNALNPPDKSKKERAFSSKILREGDKVMQIKNNYDIIWEKNGTKESGTGVYNGDLGYIKSIDRDGISVVFDEEKQVCYTNDMLEELELAYAITVHKSQGSEFNVVVIPAFYGVPKLMSRNLIYTAVTRAMKIVVLVGHKNAVEKMVDNDFEEKRYSSLLERLQD